MLEFREVGDEQAREVASVCLLHAQSHPEQVKRVLHANQNVRQCAVELLGAGAKCELGQQRELARCFLNAGFELPQQLTSPEVVLLMKERRDEDNAHWGFKRDKHGLYDDHGRHLRVPYFYAGNDTDRRYSLEDRNCELEAPGGRLLECRHLQQAAAGSPALTTKQFLHKVSCGDVGSLDYRALEHTYLAQTVRDPKVNFSRQRFGALLRRLAIRLEPGDSCSWYVGWLAVESHSMRVFLRRDLNDRIWVGFYEPGVTGNINHASFLPEHLVQLGFDQFDTTPDSNLPEVLSLGLDDPWFARSCAGAFVEPHATSQFSSLCQALADGNVWEMETSLENLGAGPWRFDWDVVAQLLGEGLHHALLNGHTAAVQKLMAVLPGLRGPSCDQIAKIVAAQDGRSMPGLCYALAMGHAATVKAFFAGLPALGLTPAQIDEIVAARDNNSDPGLYFAIQRGHVSTVSTYMAGLQGVLKTQEQITSFVDGPAREVRRDLRLADSHAPDEAADAFMAGLRDLAPVA